MPRCDGAATGGTEESIRTGKSRAADGATPKRPERGRQLEDAPRTWADVWAICKSDHGLTLEEFKELTFAEFEALEERRKVSIRYARFNTGLITATLYNAHRSSESEPVEVWDFLPGFEKDPADVEMEKRRRATKQGVVVAFSRMEGYSRERVRREAKRMVARLSAAGVEDAEDLVREAFMNVTKEAW